MLINLFFGQSPLTIYALGFLTDDSNSVVVARPSLMLQKVNYCGVQENSVVPSNHRGSVRSFMRSPDLKLRIVQNVILKEVQNCGRLSWLHPLYLLHKPPAEKKRFFAGDWVLSHQGVLSEECFGVTSVPVDFGPNVLVMVRVDQGQTLEELLNSGGQPLVSFSPIKEKSIPTRCWSL